MSAQQREAVLVILQLLNRNVPALYRVALGTVGAHLALVHVTVTIRAVFPDIGENRLDMALRALHFFVHPAQRILGLVVVKLRVRADGAPPGGGVTVLARDRQRAVRTSSGPLLRRMRWCVRRLPSK